MFKNIKTTPKIKKIIIFAIILVLIATTITSIILIKNHLEKKAELKQQELDKETRIAAVQKAIFPIARRHGIFLSENEINISMSGNSISGISSFRFKGMSYAELLSIAYSVVELGEIEDPVDSSKTLEFYNTTFYISTPTDDYMYVSQFSIDLDEMVYNGSEYPYPGLYRLYSKKCLCRLEY